jgi:hypothetical protein
MINDALLQSAVDFIAAQGHGDSEKSEILDLAAEVISNSGLSYPHLRARGLAGTNIQPSLLSKGPPVCTL